MRPGLASASCAAPSSESGEAVEARRARLLRPSHRVELSLTVGKPAERKPLPPLQIELYGGVVPKAAANFAQLCSGERGTRVRVRVRVYG